MERDDIRINQIVRGQIYGVFAVLNIRTISDGTQGADLKPLDPETHAPLRGEVFLPLRCLKFYDE
jgi:hypothetical protein